MNWTLIATVALLLDLLTTKTIVVNEANPILRYLERYPLAWWGYWLVWIVAVHVGPAWFAVGVAVVEFAVVGWNVYCWYKRTR